MNLFHEILSSLLLMPVLLALSAFFSCSETALFSLSPESVRTLRKYKRLEDLLSLLHNDPSGLLSAILFGNLLVNVLFFCTGAETLSRLADGRGDLIEALGGVLLLLLVILLGEIVPKAVGVAHPNGVLLITAMPLRSWFYFSRPFRLAAGRLLARMGVKEVSSGGGARLNRNELKELLNAVQHEPGFGAREKEILEDIVNLPDVRVREVMVPRIRVLRASLHTNRRDLFESARCRECNLALIYREQDDDLIGYVRVHELFMDAGRTESLEPFIRPLVFVPETKRADVLLREFMANDWQMVAVVDEYGGLSGTVTLEDLLAEVIGDFEPGKADHIQKLDEVTYRLNGQLSIRDWRELFTGFLPGQEVDTLAFATLGGFIISLLGRMPRTGDSVAVRNLELTVETMHNRRIGTVLLRLNEPEAQE
ncbi:MAG: hemolysin family protein [Pontiellaceae bacterium]|nr:hemolysin family protein [Pontiellaceae bacterium]